MAEKRLRRPKGDGAIFFDAEHGSWVALFSLGKNDAGKRIRRKLRAKTKPELQRRVADEKARHGGSICARAKGTVNELVDHWLDDVEANRAANTFAQYKWLLETYVVPYLGSKRIDEVDVDDVQGFYARLRRDGVTSSVLAAVATRVRTLFELAVKQRKIPFNPAALVEKPRHDAKESKYLDAEAAARFLIAARKDRLEAFYVLALTAGLRFGEAAGLCWENVDLDGGFLSVRHQLVEVKGALSLAPTKTSGSRRRIELGPLAVAALRRRHAAYKREGHDTALILTLPERGVFPHALVFMTPEGQPLRRSNVRRRSFQAIADAAGVSGLTIHGLRHTMGSLMAPSGAKPIQERMGHSSVKLTLDRYSHLLPTLQHEAATRLDKKLVGAMKAIKRPPRGRTNA